MKIIGAVFDAMGAALVSKAGAQSVVSMAVLAPFLAQFPQHIPLVAFAGLCGGVARWIADRQKLWPRGLGTILTGIMAAVFLWPVVRPLTESWTGRLDMDPETALMFGGFVAGLSGVTLIGAFVDVISSRSKRIEKGSDDNEAD